MQGAVVLMNHDRAHKVFRLRGLAAQFERGELDGEFAEAGLRIVKPELIAEQIRRLAAEIEAGAQ